MVIPVRNVQEGFSEEVARELEGEYHMVQKQVKAKERPLHRPALLSHWSQSGSGFRFGSFPSSRQAREQQARVSLLLLLLYCFCLFCFGVFVCLFVIVVVFNLKHTGAK